MKPIIGVMPLWDDEKDSLWMLPGYLDGITEAGGLPVILPFTDRTDEIEQLADMCDGFLLTGGHDVSTELYGEAPIGDLVKRCLKRDIMEKVFLKIAIDNDKPVLGICRGIQFINVALGGSLYQDIPLQYPTETNHRQNRPYNVPAHTVNIIEKTPLFNLLNIPKIQVNSLHHQAIKQLSPRLKEMAISEDGLIEAVYMPGHKFLWAVQWHPEYSHKTDSYSKAIFSEFVRSMIK